ncbi:MAG: AI-2E family transporter [Ruminococcus flavefaciens]|nr:AI-2E family transporter [Ruminococcus flavefaciens]MCM1229907.1 AI-2E family transporter [Ruminococcus flavefaciens]
MKKKELKRYLIIGLIIIAVCYVVQNFSFFEGIFSLVVSSAYPLVLGAIIAYIFNIVLSRLEKHYFPKSEKKFVETSRRPVCIVLSFLFAVAIIVLVLTIVIPSIINAFELLGAKIPPIFNESVDFLLLKLKEYPDLQKQAQDFVNEFDLESIDWAKLTENTVQALQSGVVSLLSSTAKIVGTAVSAVANIVIAVIFAIYLLSRKDKLLRDINRILAVLFDKKINKKICKVCAVADDTFKQFFVGQFIEAILLGCLCFVGMAILRLPYAGMSGVLVGVTALIPIVGAFIGAGVSAFIIFTENPMQALIFLVFLVLLQQFEGNIIYPKVVGNTVGLPGIWVLAAITVGGSLWGIGGMLVAVPLAATVYKLCFEKLEEKERESGIEPPQDESAPSKPVSKPKPVKSAKKSARKK